MKVVFTAILVLSGYLFVCSQSIIAKWSFPTGTAADSIPDEHSPGNAASFISAIGTSAIDFTKNGLTTKAAQTTQWENGENTKYWQININTEGYESITVSSVQQSGGTNAGPKYFKIQYRIQNGSWQEINGDTIHNSNDWMTSAVTDLTLPSECDNQQEVYIRWLCITDSSSNNTIVQSNGTSKIDDIIVKGNIISTIAVTKEIRPLVYCHYGTLYVNCNGSEFSQEIYTLSGTLFSITSYNSEAATHLPAGFYLVNIINEGVAYPYKIMIVNE